MKLLIVEDEKTLSNVMVDKFTEYGIEIKVADDGKLAVEMAKEFRPDVILLDLVLPGESGFEALEEIRRDVNLKESMVIVVSNLSNDSDIKRALALGANDYLVKSQHPIAEIAQKVLALLPKR